MAHGGFRPVHRLAAIGARTRRAGSRAWHDSVRSDGLGRRNRDLSPAFPEMHEPGQDAIRRTLRVDWAAARDVMNGGALLTLTWIIASALAMSAIAWIGLLFAAVKESKLERLLVSLVAFAAGSLLGGVASPPAGSGGGLGTVSTRVSDRGGGIRPLLSDSGGEARPAAFQQPRAFRGLRLLRGWVDPRHTGRLPRPMTR